MSNSNQQHSQKPTAANSTVLEASNALEDFLKNSTVSIASSSAKGAGDGNSSVHSTLLGVRAPTATNINMGGVGDHKSNVKSETNNHQSVNNQPTRNTQQMSAEKVP